MARTYTTPLKSASVPFDASGVWKGIVEDVVGYRVRVAVPRLSGDLIYGPLDVINTPGEGFTKGDPVIIGFVEGRQDELVVLGKLRRSTVDPAGSITLGSTALNLGGTYVDIQGLSSVSTTTLNVGGAASVGTNLSVGNYLSVSGNAMISGATTLLSELNVDGQISSSSAVISHTSPTTVSSGRILTLADDGQTLNSTSASSLTIQVPTNAEVAFPTGTLITVIQSGAGIVTIGKTSATVTLESEGNRLRSRGQYAVVMLYKKSTNNWVVFGNLQV